MTTATRSPAEGRTRRTSVDGRGIHVRSWTSETARVQPPVILIHGLVVSSEFFVPAAERLEDTFDLHAPDQPGFGLSDRPDGALTVSELAGALTGWMHAERFDRVHLVAVSFGCQIAAEIGMRQPELVDRLVLASPTMDPTARTVLAQMRRWRKERKTQSRDLRRLLVREYRRAGIPRAFATLRHAVADRLEDKLQYVPARTLVLRGTNDPLVPHRWAEEVARLLPEGRLAVVPDAPHAMNFDAPEAFARSVREFLLEDADE